MINIYLFTILGSSCYPGKIVDMSFIYLIVVKKTKAKRKHCHVTCLTMLLWLGHKSLSGILEKHLYKHKRKSAFSELAILLKMIQGKFVARPPLNA